jgi:hypothetical protein
MFLLAKYNTSLTIEFPVIKRGVVDYAVGADWTPAAGDVKISKDGGAAANTTNLPSAVTMGNTAIWQLTLTASEMSAARIVITISDSATKAVEDQAILILTCGHASAWFANDLTAAQYAANVTQYGGSNGTFASGRPEVNATHIAGSSVSTSTAQIGVNVVNFGGSAGTFASGRPEVNTTHIAGSAVSTSTAQIGVNVVNAGGTAWGSGAITAASIAASALDGKGDWSTYAGGDTSGTTTLLSRLTATRAGYLDNLSGGAVALASGVTVATMGAGVITSATFAAGAIDASAIAADAIGASELASDAVTEIANAVSLALSSGVTVAAINSNVITASALDASATTEIVHGVWDEDVGTHISAGSTGLWLAGIKTDTTTLLSRITSNLFSGITSLAQWLGALAGKQTANSTARTEIRATGAGSGTFLETSDSLEAIRDRGDAAWVTGAGGGGTGSGAYTVTVTVDDGTNPLQNASVRLTEGVTDLVGTTDANGEVVFGVDAATWAVAITKDGYQFTPTTLAVSGTGSQTYSMTAVAVTPNPDPDKSTVVVTCYGADTEVEPGAVLYVRQVTSPNGDEDHAFSGEEIEYTADGSGVATLTLWAGARYEIHRGDKRWLQTITPTAGSDSMSSFVGRST